ncbi:uncharacterized protein LOC106091610 [Stomoxys calcitrans]|uniref:HTH CENPB-type domain-containing protein n=1 Tax=Stomoxys calcitrans TaxID=35570 RepID=A0A1I8PA57_STOCA|nr:uncharacterized protein LOC106091610 [Stomoxys calcitrans]
MSYKHHRLGKRPCRYVLERKKLRDKPRKILNLEERVQAIRMYDELPVYQRVASAFKCSWEQIKNVVANRKEILKYYASCQIIDVMKDDPKVVRHKKINFLGNCMYEYIKRAHYHELVDITDDVIRDRAMEFKDIINIEKFFPNRAWIRDFKSVFNIDLEHMSQIIVSRKPQKSLNCKDIITYCAKEVDHALSSQPGNTKNQMTQDAERNSADDAGHLRHPIFDGDADDDEQADYDEEVINEDEEGPTIDFGDYHEDQYENLQDPEPTEEDVKPDVSILEDILRKSNNANATDVDAVKEELSEETPACETYDSNPATPAVQTPLENETRKRSISPISSYEEALALMRPLEDFAICEEDFKAINLLTQLAEVYEKAKKRKIEDSKRRNR